ncbi:MAG TPA: hypothetical protein VF883_02560 [Thermoanaerobaculia bacterium]|jgi:hypothetical protein
MRTRLLAFSLAALCSFPLFADRTQEIVDAFTKNKHVNKQKRGVTKQRYAHRHGEPAVQRDPTSLSGTYEVEGLDLTVRLTVARDGSVSGSGSDRGEAFTLRGARVDGALLTATKVYANDDRQQLEGVFMNLVSRDGTTPETATTTRAFGLGVVPDVPLRVDSMSMGKLFYARR